LRISSLENIYVGWRRIILKDKVFFVHKNSQIDNFSDIINLLPVEEALEIHRKMKNRDKETALLSKILTRTLLSEYIACDPLSLKIHKGKYGKPYLAQYPEVHYNVSHAGNMLCLAISDSEIGVDIEKEKDIEETVMQLCCTKEEYDLLKSLDHESRRSNFFKTWCLKESFLKAIGRGLSRELKSFSIIDDEGKNIRLRDYENSENYRKWGFHYEKVKRNYHFSLCSLSGAGNMEREWITQKELIRRFIHKSIE